MNSVCVKCFSKTVAYKQHRHQVSVDHNTEMENALQFYTASNGIQNTGSVSVFSRRFRFSCRFLKSRSVFGFGFSKNRGFGFGF